MATAKGEKIGVNVSVTREVALTNSKGSSPNVLYFPTDSDSFVFNGKEYAASGSRNNISGTLDVTKAATATAINNAYDNLSTGQMLFYLISDSSGNLPSLKGETSVTFHTDVAKLVNTTGAALGASVGDLFVVAKVKVLLVNVLICRILPLNDAKAANGSFPGSMGLESVWDKTQINKISGIETKANNAYSIANANDFLTRSGSNMNDCLTQGVYPWCTLGRPAGSTGAYTLVVRRSSTADGNGYYTVEQTAYGREGELGQVYKRLVFIKDSTAEYGDWIRIDSKDSNGVYKFGNLASLTTSSSYSDIVSVLGDYQDVLNACNNNKVFIGYTENDEGYGYGSKDYTTVLNVITSGSSVEINYIKAGDIYKLVVLFTGGAFSVVRSNAKVNIVKFIEGWDIVDEEHLQPDETLDGYTLTGIIIGFNRSINYLMERFILVEDADWKLTLDSFTTGNISNNLVSALKGGSVISIKTNVDAGKTYIYNGIPLSIQVDSSYNWYIQFMYNGKIIMQNFNTTDNRGGMKSIDINLLGS